MNRRSLLVLGLAALVVVIAGVFVYPMVTSPPPGGDARIELHEVDDVDGQVVSFESLTPQQQEVFERALADRYNVTSISYEENEQFWYNQPVIRYENSTYRVTVSEPD